MSKKKQAGEAALEAEVFPQSVEETPPPPPEETRSPDAWAAEIFPRSPRGRQNALAYLHGAAAALHQWTSHAHHAGAPMQLTRADYEAAIEAAKSNAFAPHPAALSPFAGRS